LDFFVQRLKYEELRDIGHFWSDEDGVIPKLRLLEFLFSKGAMKK
jgi:hypothetical protein